MGAKGSGAIQHARDIHGLCEDGMKLEDVGQMYGITKQRVLQIRNAYAQELALQQAQSSVSVAGVYGG